MLPRRRCPATGHHPCASRCISHLGPSVGFLVQGRYPGLQSQSNDRDASPSHDFIHSGSLMRVLLLTVAGAAQASHLFPVYPDMDHMAGTLQWADSSAKRLPPHLFVKQPSKYLVTI